MQVWNVLLTARGWLEIQDTKNCHMHTISQHVSTIGKNLLNSNMSSTRLHNMANFGPLMAEIGSGVWGTPANFNGFRILPLLLLWRRSPEANRTLHDVWPSPGLVHYIYIFRGLLPPDRILLGAKFTLCPSPAFAYVGNVTARLSSSGRQPNFVASCKEWNYGAFAEGASYTRQGGHARWASAHILVCSCIVCFCFVRFSFFSTMPKDWLGRMSPKWRILCHMGCKTWTQSVNQSSR